MYQCAVRNHHVLRLCNSVTVNGQTLSDKRNSVLQVLADKCRGGNVRHNDPQGRRKNTCITLLTGHLINQDTLCTLRVAGLQRENMKALQILLPDHLIELINGILLVDLDGDVDVASAPSITFCASSSIVR